TRQAPRQGSSSPLASSRRRHSGGRSGRKGGGHPSCFSSEPRRSIPAVAIVIESRAGIERQSLMEVLVDELRLAVRRGIEESQNRSVFRLRAAAEIIQRPRNE